MKKIFTTVLVAFSALLGIAQNPTHRTCGTNDYHEYLKQTRKGYEADFIQYNQMLDQYMKSPQFSSMRTSAATITIPVVIHVVYNTAVQNISDAQAISQFSVLDNDFNHLNADTTNIPLPFRAVAGKTGIRFCLAVRDPSGNATTGIVHKSTTVTSFITDNKVKATATGGDDPWDVTKYMNIWICPLGNNLLGYGEFPTGTISNTYGLVLNYTASGTMGTAAAPFNKGRTGTHEFGHCFNLNHIWGDNGQCGNTDNCTDTPPQKGGTTAPAGCNYGTPTYPWQPNTCTRPDGVAGANVTNTNGDMFMNFMDYTDDGAMNMFTKEQCLRMVAVVSTAPWNILQSSNACTPVSALDAGITSVISPINGSSSCNNTVIPKITLANAGSATLTSAIIQYKMDALATQTLNWTGSLVNPASTILTLNTYSGLANGVHTFSVWVSSPNGGVDANAANNSQTSTFTISTAAVGNALPFTEGFESVTFPPTGWALQKSNTLNAATSWSRIANTTGLTAGSTAIARMDNYTSTVTTVGQLDALRTPALTFTAANTSLNLSFDVSHRIYSATYIDTLNVYISSDCGGTWTRLYTKGGTQLANAVTSQTTAYTPTVNTQWRRESVSLSSYVGLSSVYLKFESRSGWGNHVYLDNINISYTTAATPPVASFSVSTPKCVGSAINFTDLSTNTPIGWSWSFPGGTPSTSTAQNPSVTYSASGTYSATLTSANISGTSTAVTQTIAIIAKPTVAATSSSVCAGSTKTLTASGASTYTWSSGALTSTVVLTPSVTTSYTVIGTSVAGCTNSAVGTISVTALPIVVAPSTSICAGSSSTITASGALTYSWSSGALTASIAVTPTTTTSYTVSGLALTGCRNTAIATVSVNALPTVAATSATTCSGSLVSLTASGASTYSWSTGAATSSISITPTVLTSYTVTGTSAAGCKKTAIGTVSVTALPIVAATSATACAGAAKVLTGSGASTYSWSTGASTSTVSVSPTITSSYTVTGTALSGCKNTAVGTLSVTALPIVVSTNTSVCIGGSKTLIASGALTYSWSTGVSTSSISVAPTTTTSYTVTGTAATGCKNTAVGTVSVNALPVVAATSATICSGSTGTLTASGASTYSWSTGSTGASLTANPLTLTNYTVVGTSVAGCSNIAFASIAVGSAPSIVVNSTTICAGSSATLTASGVNTYTWSTGANTSAITDNPVGTTIYTVSGNLAGCSTGATQSATITVNSLPTVSLSPISIMCLNSSPANLIGSPVGGVYSGTGVTGSTFDPAVSGAGTFNVMYNYTDVNNCSNSASQSASVSLCTGVDQANNMSSISIYPNPANDVIYVNLGNVLSENSVIELYDAIGKLVMSQKVVDSISTLSITNFAKGIYSVRILVDSHQMVKRIIKE